VTRYDAILLASFGGPEGQDDVIPFLRNVTRGRGVPDERLEEVAHHYRHFGGVSPINAQNAALRAALEAELRSRGVDLPVLWGNRNWAPYVEDVARESYEAGHRRVLGVVTSAYTSYSGVKQYLEDFDRAIAAAGEGYAIDRVREYFDHPGFVEPFVRGTRQAIEELRAATGREVGDGIRVLFSTHSIPLAAAVDSGPGYGPHGAYEAQHLAVARYVMDQVTGQHKTGWELVYQSRSGDPRTPWLEPDVNDVIRALPDEVAAVVIVPIGFVSDHMEVLWDLDTEAMETAAEKGVLARRVGTPGTDPVFVAGLVDLIQERLDDVPESERRHVTELGPWPDGPQSLADYAAARA